MDFNSKILRKIKQSKNYCDGEYKFDCLIDIVDIQYAITNTAESWILEEKTTNRLEKFTDLENLFLNFIHFLNKSEFENYKRIISQKLTNESLINWTEERIEKEKKRLFEEIKLTQINIEWRKDFRDIVDENISYNEKYEIGLRFIDEKYVDEREIYVEIDSISYKIKAANFEAL
ncbi:hypothetical protein [Chryseobacterium sp.]|uniref:hypothetical protein n=1 Tax=Chryseobacterium sp. TaxID=1871047 RepID=UPI00289A2F87|nr:hypothetical protein [Chryseobacterium sp.]